MCRAEGGGVAGSRCSELLVLSAVRFLQHESDHFHGAEVAGKSGRVLGGDRGLYGGIWYEPLHDYAVHQPRGARDDRLLSHRRTPCVYGHVLRPPRPTLW